MRARIEELERDLERALARIAELEPQAEEAETLRVRAMDLERELAAFREQAPRKSESSREKRRRLAKERDARAPANSKSTETKPDNSLIAWFKEDGAVLKVMAGLAGACALAGLAYWQLAPPTWTNSLAPPSLGLIDLARTPSPPMVHGSTVGERPTPMGCIGMIPGAPHLVLATQEPTLVLLDVESDEDTVLVVLDAAGAVHCDDDGGGGHNPYLAAPLPPGEARVWVGTYSGDVHADFSLTLGTREGAAMPDARGIAPNASPRFGVLGQGFEGMRRFEGSVLGVTHTTSIDQRCLGHIETQPSLTIELTEPAYVDLNAGGDVDLTLFLESSGIIRCDDDSGAGTQPRLTELLPEGTHHLWVGTYARQSTPSPFWLEARMVARTSVSDAPMQWLALEQPVEIAPRSEALVRECNALIPMMADARIELTAPFDVATSGAILVADAAGRRCLTPGVTTWSAGVHDVYLAVDVEDAQHMAHAVTLQASAPSLLPYPK